MEARTCQQRQHSSAKEPLNGSNYTRVPTVPSRDGAVVLLLSLLSYFVLLLLYRQMKGTLLWHGMIFAKQITMMNH
jgi:hypothetical protein